MKKQQSELHIELAIRIFHWVLAVSFIILYVTGINGMGDEYLHITFGNLLTGLFAARILWHFLGHSNSKLSSYIAKAKNIFPYLKKLIFKHPVSLEVHNPAGSLMILSMLTIFISLIISGIFIQSFIHFSGLFYLFEEVFFDDANVILIKKIHYWIANILLFMTILHISGVLISSKIYQFNFPYLMLTGKPKFLKRKKL